MRSDSRRVLPLLAPVLLLGLACNTVSSALYGTPTPAPTPTPSPYQSTIDAFEQLQGSQPLPDHLMVEDQDPVKIGGEFDAMAYFDVLDHLSMEPGYVLDYVYQFDGLGGHPILYARPEDQPPYETVSEYHDAGAQNQASYLDHVQVDGTEAGFFQFAALNVMGGQFYLFWHAFYFDDLIIADSNGLERLIENVEGFCQPMGDNVLRRARALKLTPVVDLQPDVARVEVITFSKWGGFSHETFEIARSFPHIVLGHQAKTVIPYDCGIAF